MMNNTDLLSGWSNFAERAGYGGLDEDPLSAASLAAAGKHLRDKHNAAQESIAAGRYEDVPDSLLTVEQIFTRDAKEKHNATK